MSFSRSDAPGELKRLQEFCNSARFLYAEDSLGDPAGAEAWLRDHGLAAEALNLDQQQLDRIVHAREAIRAHLGGQAETSDVLNDLARETLASPGWSAAGRPALTPRATGGIDALLGGLLADLFLADTRGETARLKPCRAADCRWVFYDRSPAKNSTWCSMDICGARHKMRTYRARQAGSRPGGG